MSALAIATGPADRELDDLDLVAAVRAGDDRAFEVLFLRYQPRIAAYVTRMVRDHGRAEDITQEVFMSALRRLREADEREITFRPWIYEIAKNKCIDAYRRGRHMTEVSFDAHDQVGAADHGRLAGPGATPDVAVEGKLAFDSLRGAFGGLSPVHHEILVMREFEGLSYREIGERLEMSRPAVESTLFRARKRLGEEYEELVSGKRCLRVQSIVDDAGAGGPGLRDQRRVARHLSHCQPCRRYAHLAGADLDFVRPSVAARVAAFLPLPAFLRRRWGGGEEASQVLAQQAHRPVVQWSAHVAGTMDPGAISGWAKAAATAATVALAGVGGAAIEHRGTAGPSAAAAAAAAAGEQARSPLPGGVASGLLSPTSVNPGAAASGATEHPAAGGGHPVSGAPGGPASPAASGEAPGAGAGAPAADPQHPPQGGPNAPVAGATDPTAAPVPGAAGDPARALPAPVDGATKGSGGSGNGGSAKTTDKLPGSVAPVADGATAPADTALSNGGGGSGGGTGTGGGAGKALAPVVDAVAPGRSGDAPGHSGHAPGHSGAAPGHAMPAKGAPADAPSPAPAGAAHGSPPNGRGHGAQPRASGPLANPTAAAPGLGG